MNTNPCKLVSKNVVSVHIHLHSLANILATFFYVNNIFLSETGSDVYIFIKKWTTYTRIAPNANQFVVHTSKKWVPRLNWSPSWKKLQCTVEKSFCEGLVVLQKILRMSSSRVVNPNCMYSLMENIFPVLRPTMIIITMYQIPSYPLRHRRRL